MKTIRVEIKVQGMRRYVTCECGWRAMLFGLNDLDMHVQECRGEPMVAP